MAAIAEGAEIGLSKQGRPLLIHFAGAEASPLRILILAGQHGDEGIARAAARQFFEEYHSSRQFTRIAFVPDINPDGSAAKQRTNADGIDLNRDHQCLYSPEIQSLHAFIRTWQPHLIIDVHSYPSRRSHLLKHNLVHCHDVFIDAPTNPSVPNFRFDERELMESTLSQLNHSGYCAGRYRVASDSGRVRHGTANVRDARNGLALRYGIPTLLIEGRKPVKSDSREGRIRLRSAMQTAIGLIVEIAATSGKFPLAPADGKVAIRSRYIASAEPCTIPFKDVGTGTIRIAPWPGVFFPRVSITRQVALPQAYAVPMTHTAVIELLDRHGFASNSADVSTIYETERDRFVRMRISKHPGRMPRAKWEMTREQRPLSDHLIYEVTPETGPALAVFLEADSKYGLHRCEELNLKVQSDGYYPVTRVMSRNC